MNIVETFQDFVPAAKGIVAGGIVLALWAGARVAIANHKAHKANRAEVDAILRRSPPVKAIEISKLHF